MPALTAKTHPALSLTAVHRIQMAILDVRAAERDLMRMLAENSTGGMTRVQHSLGAANGQCAVLANEIGRLEAKG